MESAVKRVGSHAAEMQIDLNDPVYRKLSRFGNRIGKLLTRTNIQGSPHALGTLDDFLGVIYALILAKHGEFEDRTKRSIDVPTIERRVAQVATGQVRLDGGWMAGFHFNSALLRVAAVYHRVLQVVVGRPDSKQKEYVPTIRPEAKKLYKKWKTVEWSSGHVDAVHSEVNGLKHVPKGVYFRRKVKYNDAVASVGELLDLLEAWADA